LKSAVFLLVQCWLKARAVICPSISPPSGRCFYTYKPKSVPKVLVWQGSSILHSLKEGDWYSCDTASIFSSSGSRHGGA